MFVYFVYFGYSKIIENIQLRLINFPVRLPLRGGAVAPSEASPGSTRANASAGKPPLNRARRSVIGRKAH